LTLPGPRTLLIGAGFCRLILVAALIGRAVAPQDPAPLHPAIVIAIIAAAIVGTIWLGLKLRKSELPSPTTILLQASLDVLVITGLVAFTSGPVTPLAALYVLVVTLYAMLLPVGRALLAVAFAVTSYVLISLRSAPPEVEFWTQVGVISFVGMLIAILGHRLASASHQQQALAVALREARFEADDILASIQSGVLTVDGNGRLAYINPRARRILGGDGAFSPGDPVLEVLRSRSRDLHDAIVRGLEHGTRVARAEASVRRQDGSLFPVGLSTATFQRAGGSTAVTAIFTDISDLKRLQEFRLRAERLEAVAALSASLAHEIRNPLAAIRSAVEQLATRVGGDEDDQVLARLVMRESERLNRLLSEFLDFSRVRAARFESLDLLVTVQEAARFVMEHPAVRGIKVEVTGEPLMIEADPDLIHRIATNLLLNAAQALNGSGTIHATVDRSPVGEAPSSAVDRPIRLMISDDGPGIPEQIRDRLFEPFVSGRPGGSGLGLAIVQRAVSAHRGIILVDSAAGRGTTFSIFLPATWNREESA
jgi:two-component system sensor histidine kinase PilS (NtrC family)